ncbi:MAG: alpha/beta hydrolase-fold protein [Saprospiraceae bacterium]|nr:tetratricopeptide repeat protein [Lewinella sp.]
MRLSFTLFLLFFTIAIQTNYAQDGEDITIGKKYTIHSSVLDEEREYWVSLPVSYDNEFQRYKRYPVMVVLDGPTHFRPVSGMVEAMSAGYNGNRQIPEMIVVAIRNVNRERDFTPDKVITVRKNDTGGGDRFLSFLEDELFPELDQNYRTLPYRILMGHSLGGLLATHAYLKEQTLFNAFIAVDPSFGTWDAEKMDGKLEKVTDQSFNRYLYIATANGGKRNFRNRDRHIRLFEALHSKCPEEFNAKLDYFEEENHSSVPLIAVYHGLSAIFSGYGFNYREATTANDLKRHFQTIAQRLAFDFPPPEELVNRIGYWLLRSNNEQEQQEALHFFKLNTELYPASFNAFDSLGEAYADLKNNEMAIESYQKSLELNPDNKNAETMIMRLNEK